MTEKYRGAVKWYDDVKGYGFVYLPDIELEAFIHKSTVKACGLSEIKKHDYVEVSVTEKIIKGSKKLEARAIVLLPAKEISARPSRQASKHSQETLKANVRWNKYNGELTFDGRTLKFCGGFFNGYSVERSVRSIKEVEILSDFITTKICLKGPGGHVYIEYPKPIFGQNNFYTMISAIKSAISRS